MVKREFHKMLMNIHILTLRLRLTSWVLIALKDTTQAEWEQYNLFIDPRVRAKSSKWIMTHQNPDGSFEEHSNILDREKFQVIFFTSFIVIQRMSLHLVSSTL